MKAAVMLTLALSLAVTSVLAQTDERTMMRQEAAAALDRGDRVGAYAALAALARCYGDRKSEVQATTLWHGMTSGQRMEATARAGERIRRCRTDQSLPEDAA